MLTSLPDPAPDTVRRTLSIEVSPDGDWSAGLRVTASGRDLLVDGGGADRVLRAARMSVTLDTASRVTGIESELAASVTDSLIGATAVRGFRARLAGWDDLDPSSIESAVLDELPTVRLISGYARMIELITLTGADGVAEAAADEAGMTSLRSDHDRRSPLVGVCAGWAPGATADTRVRAGCSAHGRDAVGPRPRVDDTVLPRRARSPAEVDAPPQDPGRDRPGRRVRGLRVLQGQPL